MTANMNDQRADKRRIGEKAGFYVMKQLTTINSNILKVILATIVTSAILKARPNSVLTRI